jgi:3-methyl-2-oxobutanoate hydroxymethyltransferase
MIHHTRAVSHGVRRALLIADMPFLSYQTDINQAVYNAGRFLKEAGADAVKVEGAGCIIPAVARMVEIGIPVVGHLGLTPQSFNKFGGFKVQAKTPEAAQQLLHDALQLQEAGVFSIVLEGIPAPVAAEVTKELKVPTIGIGAGVACDGQVLVCYDAFGMFDDFRPKFVKQYAQVGETIRQAVRDYGTEVKNGQFPDPEHSFGSFQEASKR